MIGNEDTLNMLTKACSFILTIFLYFAAFSFCFVGFLLLLSADDFPTFVKTNGGVDSTNNTTGQKSGEESSTVDPGTMIPSQGPINKGPGTEISSKPSINIHEQPQSRAVSMRFKTRRLFRHRVNRVSIVTNVFIFYQTDISHPASIWFCVTK